MTRIRKHPKVRRHYAILVSRRLGLFHCPLCGPMQPEGLGWHAVRFQYDYLEES